MWYYILNNRIIILLKGMTNAKTINAQHPKNVKATIRTIKKRLNSPKKKWLDKKLGDE
jgi:hypothetical protein